MPKRFLKFGFFFLALAVTALLGELAVRRLFPQITYSDAVKLSIDCYAPGDRIPFTLGKNYTCKMTNILNEYNTTATLNSQGYRGREFAREKSKGVRRILVVGDSMTFGWGVSDRETYPYLLEQELKGRGIQNVEVINAGYKGGLSPDSEYIYLKNEGFSLKPDILILGFLVWNDITDISGNIWKTDKDGLPLEVTSCCHTVDGRILRNKVTPARYRLPFLRDSHLYIFLFDLIQNRWNIFKEANLYTFRGEAMMGCALNPDCIHLFSPEEEKVYRVITAIKKLAALNNTYFLPVLLPVDVQFYEQAKAKYREKNLRWFPKVGEENFIQKRVGEILSKNNIDYVDVFADFENQKDKVYPFFPADAHFNEKGTKIVASSLANYLVEKKLIK